MNALPVRLTIDQAWAKWRNSKDLFAREWLVIHYASLVKFVAGRLAAGLPRSVEVGDLVSSGVFGLMNAIDRFDSTLGFKFETYAIPRIRGAILDSLRSMDWVPRSVRAHSRNVQQAISELEQTNKRAPTDEEIAAKIGISNEELEKWLTEIAASNVGPLDHLVAESQATIGGASFVPSPDAAVEAKDLQESMRAEIQRLPSVERTILVLYYEENLTLSEIGEVLGISESRVSQVHSKAVLQLRSRLAIVA